MIKQNVNTIKNIFIDMKLPMSVFYKPIFAFIFIIIISISPASAVLVNNATTSGWTSVNVSLNGSRITDNGLLANHLNASYLTGLVGYWSMDETTGTILHNVNTESGVFNSTNQGTWNGNTSLNYTTGSIGNAGNFDGVNDYVSAAYNSAFNTMPITISARVQARNGTGGIVNRYANTVVDGYQIWLSSSRVKAWYYFWDGSTHSVDMSAAVDDGGVIDNTTFHNTVFVVDNTSGRIYVDGILKNTKVWTGTPIKVTTTLPLKIGALSDASGNPTSFFNGTIDEVKIWNRALSTSEVSEEYNRSMRVLAMPVLSNQTASTDKVIYRARVNYTGHDVINKASIYSRQNGTTSWSLVQSNATSGIWYSIAHANQFNRLDFGIQMDTNGGDTVFIESLEWDEITSIFITTNAASGVSAGGVTLNGNVAGVVGSATVWFEYGTGPGIYPYKTSNQTVTGDGAYTQAISGMPILSDTTYYYRAVGYDTETHNGAEVSFTTPALGTIPDYDFDAHFTNLTDSELDPTNMSKTAAQPYTDLLGSIFWGILYSAIFVMIWIRQEDISIPSILGLIIGASLWASMPSDWTSMAMSLTVVSFAGVLYSIIKGRG